MSLFGRPWLDQINIDSRLSYKPGTDPYIHGLNPLRNKYEKHLCPEECKQGFMKKCLKKSG